ncbi:MAG: choice-of-anchor B family protein, partial [Thermoflexales bacterium]
MRPLFFALISSCLALGLSAQDVSFASRGPEPMGHSGSDAREAAPGAKFSTEPIPLQPQAFTPCVGGLAAGYPCNKVDLLSLLPLANMGGGTGSGNWGWTDPATGKEYALMGLSNGTAFVDVTDPINPVYLGKLPTHTVNSSWRELKTLGNYALIVSEASGHGMQIFDLTRLRTVVSPPVTFTESAHYPGFSNGHNVAANPTTGYAYAVGTSICGAGIHFINMANPLAPASAGCFSSDGYVHDLQCVIYQGPDAAYYGREICFASDTDSVTIVDVTNKAAPVQLSRTTYPGAGYTHQGWLTDDQTRFLINDELDEQNVGHNTRTRIFNISDLNAPVLSGVFDGPNTAIDHNMYVVNSHLYQANYRAGLRILSLAQVNSGILSEVASFDTYPPSNSANFNSAWNVYPFLASGSILISDIEKGLFVVRATSVPVQPGIRLQPAAPGVSICDPGSVNVGVQVQSVGGFTGPVSLSLSGLPANVSAVFTPPTVNAGSGSTLSLTASGATPVATALTVSGSAAGPLADAKPLMLAIAAPLTAPAALVSPAPGVVFAPLQPQFTWSAPIGSTSTLEIATNPAFAPILYSATLPGSSHVPAVTLAPGTLHYWRVVTWGGCGDTMTAAA